MLENILDLGWNSAHDDPHIVKATCTPLREIIRTSLKLTFNQCRDIVSLSILIGSRRTRADMPRYSAIKSQFVYENLLYSPLPHADSFPSGATPWNEITLFNSLFAYITHMGVFEGNPRFLSEHVNRV